ncbi:MAG: acyl-CoA reductase [Lachnospiraceae bacterium]
MKNPEKIEFVFGNEEILRKMTEQKPMKPFSDEALLLLDSLSARIRSCPGAKEMADVAAFGFWCRRAGMIQKKESYERRIDYRLGRGITLHFVPSNLPVLFAFSMAASILAGNCVIMRIPSRRSKQAEAILHCLEDVLHALPEWSLRIVFLRYGHEKAITDMLSGMCDIRVIWGGDASVTEIRKSALPPRAVELTFANRSSAAVIKASEIIKNLDLADLSRKFYNDTYLNDQNACSSPGIIYWLGTKGEIESAKKTFWNAVYEYGSKRYEVTPVLVIKKWEQAACIGATVCNTQIVNNENLIVRADVPMLSEEDWDYLSPGGFFIESGGESLQGLLPVLTERCQTVTCFGISCLEIGGFFAENRVSGADRIVEFGHALDFSLIWDGFDLIASMSRIISFM